MKASVSQLLKEAESVKTALADDCPTSVSAFQLRTRLCWLLEELLLTDLEFALDKKVEQELWNCAFRNPISAFQAKVNDKKKRQNGETQSMLSMLLETASGFYLQLLQKLCSVYNIGLRCHLSDSAYGVLKFERNREQSAQKPKKSSVLYICQHCLVHLGDIARYRGQSLQAENFYRHAVELGPRNGHPYNQLALLEAASGEKLSTVFFYVRSLALQHPFPAAATNLATLYSKMLADGSGSVGKVKMTPYEYTTAFLQFNAHIYLVSDMGKAERLLGSLTASLPALVIAEKLETWQLVQMAAVCIFTHEHAYGSLDGDKKNGTLDESLSQDEKKALANILDLISSMLHALLLPMHALQDSKSMRDCCTVPVVKLILDWLLLNRSYLFRDAFARKPQIWHGFCKLLNALVEVVPLDFPKENYLKVPLPEDWDLHCFLPLQEVHRNLHFNTMVPLPSDVNISNLRGSRMLDLAEELGQVVMSGKSLIAVAQGQSPRYTASHYTEAMSNQVMQQIQELSIEPEQELKQTGPSSPSSKTDLPDVLQTAPEVRFKLDTQDDQSKGDTDKRTAGKPSVLKERRPARNVAMQAILQQKEQRSQLGDVIRQPVVLNNDLGTSQSSHLTDDKPDCSLWHPQALSHQHNGIGNSTMSRPHPNVPPPYLHPPVTGRRPQSPQPAGVTQAISYDHSAAATGTPQQNTSKAAFLPSASPAAPPYMWNYLVSSHPPLPTQPPPPTQQGMVPPPLPQMLHTSPQGMPQGAMPPAMMPQSQGPAGFMYMGPSQPPTQAHLESLLRQQSAETKFSGHSDSYQQHIRQQPQLPQMSQIQQRPWLPHGIDMNGCSLLPAKSGQQPGSSGSETSTNTYSLFNSPWPSGLQHVAKDGGRSSGSGAPIDPMVMHPRIQSLWSGPGPSPLERLLEQQKQWRDGAMQ
ncbi:nonsense-mediated mRNA decay factor SMG7-like [Ornithodoros turicata]|uniref:nonsense-mediated mRNA decay factor SMG7-like n=1 Tax=Ornithodoros turicata TaxID=34597 RepID=UPI0031388E17